MIIRKSNSIVLTGPGKGRHIRIVSPLNSQIIYIFQRSRLSGRLILAVTGSNGNDGFYIEIKVKRYCGIVRIMGKPVKGTGYGRRLPLPASDRSTRSCPYQRGNKMDFLHSGSTHARALNAGEASSLFRHFQSLKNRRNAR